MQRFLVIFIFALLTACYAPVAEQAAAPVPGATNTQLQATSTPTELPTTDAPCAFVEGRQTLDDVSAIFLEKLKAASLPVESARAEAYGENCLAADGSLVRFAARETDFYLALTVSDLLDEAALGGLLEQTLAIVDQFPIDQTPGPNPGYVGIAFKAGEQLQNLWFTQTEANDLRSQGLKGADLYRALKRTP
ncbi:MAG: hypothetical protein NT121_07100 [Chloroflexi bacterium]|nr:hypothetical protein [Chloroflexota bacterium]